MAGPDAVKPLFQGDRRLGSFSIQNELVRQAPPEELAKVFTGMIVLRAELLAESDAFEYVAWSKHFRPIEVGEQVPIYFIEITTDTKPGGGLNEVTAIRFIESDA